MQRRTSDYMRNYVNMCIAVEKLTPPSVNAYLLCSSSSPIQKAVFQSLEILDQKSNVTIYAKEVETYIDNVLKAIRRYIDLYKKQVALARETIEPLITAHQTFVQVYGDTVLDEITDKLSLSFYKKYGDSFRLFETLKGLMSYLTQLLTGESAVQCSKLLDCSIDDHGQLAYPSINDIVAQDKTTGSISTLGYRDVHEFVDVLHAVSFVSTLKTFDTIDNILKSLLNIPELRTALMEMKTNKNVKQNLAVITKHMTILHNISVAFNSALFILQAASYSAYEAAYTLHLAEIAYNRRNSK